MCSFTYHFFPKKTDSLRYGACWRPDLPLWALLLPESHILCICVALGLPSLCPQWCYTSLHHACLTWLPSCRLNASANCPLPPPPGNLYTSSLSGVKCSSLSLWVLSLFLSLSPPEDCSLLKDQISAVFFFLCIPLTHCLLNRLIQMLNSKRWFYRLHFSNKKTRG